MKAAPTLTCHAEYTPLPEPPTFQELLARLYIISEISAALKITACQMLVPMSEDEMPGLVYLSHSGAERICKEADALISGIEDFKETFCPSVE